jgi:hypothetical protein
MNGARRNIRNNGKQCLDVWGGRNLNNQHLTWWTCHNGVNQAWFTDQKEMIFKKYPIRDGRKFQIKTRMNENRALFWHEAIAANQFRLRIRDTNPGDKL